MLKFFKREFKREKETATGSADEVNPVYQPSASLTGKSANSEDIQSARNSIQFLTNEFKTSADQQQVAAKRMAALNRTLAKMESGLRQLPRLEGQNSVLSTELMDVRKKLEQKSTWASEQENKLIMLERRHNEMKQLLESAKADVAQGKDRSAADKEKLIQQGRYIENLASKMSQSDENLSFMQISNQNLQDEIAKQAAEISSKSHRVMELQKNLEELSLRLDRKTKENDTSTAELKELRSNFSDIKTKYFETSGALENAKYDIRTQKNVFEETVKRRDDETLALKSRIEQLNTQLRIKDNMSSHFDEEVIALRSQLENERERNDRNELRFRGKADEVERNARALARAKVEYETLNAKFVAAMEDVETLRKINQVQRQKLERYAAIGGVSVGQSLIAAEAAKSDVMRKANVSPNKAIYTVSLSDKRQAG